MAGKRPRGFKLILGAVVGALAFCVAESEGRASPNDEALHTLEDVYGVPSAESFQTAIGFRVTEGNSTEGAPQSRFGVSVDDPVVAWRENATGGAEPPSAP